MRFFKNPQEIGQFISHKKTVEQLLSMELLKEGSAARKTAETFVGEDKQKDRKRVGGGDRYPHGPKKVWDEDCHRRYHPLAIVRIHRTESYGSRHTKLLRQQGLEGKALQAVRKGFRR